MESGPNGQNGSAGGESVGDRNIERLLSEAYAPERPDAAFARRVGERMLAAARGRVRRRPATRLWRGLAYAAAAAALVAAGFFAARVLRPFSPLDLGPHPRAARPRRGGPDRRDRVPAPAAPAAGLTARPRPEARPAPKLSRGAKLRTGPRQRRRVTLPNGAVAYVNAGTKLSVPGYREMTLTRGEVYLEVPPHRTPGAVGPTYVVQTPHRKVLAYGTRFAVRADDEGTRVLVTQGKVGVTGYGGLVHAGRQLRCGAEAEGGELAAIGRASHELEWTKDLLAAARGPLVPASDYAGGALVAVDPDGQEARLSLRTYHVDVHVEDGFSRTTIDQTYFNHMNRRLEGTFYFPLPPDASISRLAMYVNGKLMEGGMAERAHARHVFETIMYTRRDPALLEWVDGSTFKMRVFPLEARQEKRIVLSYTQRLEGLYGRLAYRFCGGHNMPQVGEWSFHARVVSAADSTWAMPTHEPEARTEGGDLLIDVRRKNVAPDDDVVLHVFEDESSGQRFERFSTAVHEGRRYLMLRYRPDLNVAAEGAARRRDWVFLFESSGDRDPLLARAQIDVVRSLLDRAGHDDSFHILAIGTHVRSWRASAAALTRDAVAEAAAYLDKVHLVGALDLAGGLAAAAEALREADDPVLVHVGSGVPVLGERKTDRLVKLIPRRARYVGVGVGKRYNRAFMKAAAAATGGYFTQINPD